MREYVTTTVFSENYGPLSPRTHLTVEATNAGLSHNAVELRLLRVLATDVTDLGLGIVRDEPRLIWRDGTTTLVSVFMGKRKS